MATFDGRRALITGGSRGIGLATARRLVEAGALVTIVGQNHDRVERALGDLSRKGSGRVFGLTRSIDGSTETSEWLAAEAERKMGGLDLLLNAAGGATVGPILDLSWATWREDFDVKFWGYLSLMYAVIPFMRQAGHGAIINIVGVAGKDPNPKLAVSTAINGALNGVTKMMADALAPSRIRVVNVNPGATDTDLLLTMAQGYARLQHKSPETMVQEMRQNGPLGRLPRADDIAAAIAFLMSDEASVITGTSLDIDGGVHRGPA